MRKPLALLPGLLDDRAVWEPVAERLGDIATVTVPNLTRQETIAGMARAVLEEMPERFALAGLSMGGYVALEIMRQSPASIDRLALVDTSARPDTPEQTARRHALIAEVEQGQFRGIRASLLPSLVARARLNDLALAETLFAMAERVGKEAFIRQQQAIMARVDSRPILPAIGCPTLVLGGREDALTPPAVLEEMAAGIPGARLEIIEECGHLAPLECPDAVAAHFRNWLSARS
jgi:pimeloyl-ACP methyl ester carboxylesterase